MSQFWDEIFRALSGQGDVASVGNIVDAGAREGLGALTSGVDAGVELASRVANGLVPAVEFPNEETRARQRKSEQLIQRLTGKAERDPVIEANMGTAVPMGERDARDVQQVLNDMLGYAPAGDAAKSAPRDTFAAVGDDIARGDGSGLTGRGKKSVRIQTARKNPYGFLGEEAIRALDIPVEQEDAFIKEHRESKEPYRVLDRARDYEGQYLMTQMRNEELTNAQQQRKGTQDQNVMTADLLPMEARLDAAMRAAERGFGQDVKAPKPQVNSDYTGGWLNALNPWGEDEYKNQELVDKFIQYLSSAVPKAERKDILDFLMRRGG